MVSPLDRNYAYARRLPHYQKPGVPVFVTFRKLLIDHFTDEARSAILDHCLRDNGKRYVLHGAVIMPSHAHLLFTPLPDAKGWPFSLPVILKSLKGSSARTVNKLMGTEGPVWQDESFDHVLRSNESTSQKLDYICQNPVRARLVNKPEDYPWLWVERS